MMQPTIKKQDLTTEFYTEENCFITELSNTADDPELSIARARVKPGVTTQWHYLKETAERYVIIEGTGIVEIGDSEPTPVCPGDVVLIPPGYRQRITNSGSCDLLFLALCTPRFEIESYVEITTDV